MQIILSAYMHNVEYIYQVNHYINKTLPFNEVRFFGVRIEHVPQDPSLKEQRR